jgi:diguanylate cyclase (GGDEF)-like protein
VEITLPTPDRNASRPPILLAEDSTIIQTVLRNMLVLWGYEVTAVTNGLEAWRILQAATAPRLAIIDWMMPGLQGPDICRRLRAEKDVPYTYVLILTSRDDREDVVEGLDAGADDYLTKPFHAQELRARVRAGERIIRLQADLLAARDQLRERATIDPLTGLLNRATILEQLESELAAADRARNAFSILLVDIERFRHINDSFGHLTGDAVLCEFGQRVAAVLPPGAAVGRFSGEEFLIVLPGIAGSECQTTAEMIRNTVAEGPFQVGAATFPVSCSIGAAERRLPQIADAADLLHFADDALREAKAESQRRVAGALRAAAESVAAPRARPSGVTNSNLVSI